MAKVKIKNAKFNKRETYTEMVRRDEIVARLIYLVVPFAEKDKVKALGARWHADSKRWYIRADYHRAEELREWFPLGASLPKKVKNIWETEYEFSEEDDEALARKRDLINKACGSSVKPITLEEILPDSLALLSLKERADFSAPSFPTM